MCVKYTEDQLEAIWTDLLTVVKWFNLCRQNGNKFVSENGLNPADKNLDPYYLYCGGAELTKLFSKDWQLAAKIAGQKNELKAIRGVDDINQSGFDSTIFGVETEEKAKAYMYVPGKPIPNSWTGNKYSQCKVTQTLLMSFGCGVDGTIKKLWASIVKLEGNPDGKSGDWKFSANSNDNAFSTFTLTKEITDRPSYQQAAGTVEVDYGVRGDAKKGMKLVLESC